MRLVQGISLEFAATLTVITMHAVTPLTGLDPAKGEPAAPSPLDGIDAWPWISGKAQHSTRHELVYMHNMFINATTVPNTTTLKCVPITTKRAGTGGCFRGTLPPPTFTHSCMFKRTRIATQPSTLAATTLYLLLGDQSLPTRLVLVIL
jgi:hypothetical protein